MKGMVLKLYTYQMKAEPEFYMENLNCISSWFVYIDLKMILIELRQRMEKEVDEVSNIAKNIKEQLEALDREVNLIWYAFFSKFLS